MTLLNLLVELSQVIILLTRIADALDRAVPIPVIREKRLRGVEAIVDVRPESVQSRLALDRFIEAQGLSPAEAMQLKSEVEELPEIFKKQFMDSL